MYIYAAHVENTDSATGKRQEGCNARLQDGNAKVLRLQNDVPGAASVISDLAVTYKEEDKQNLEEALVTFHSTLNAQPHLSEVSLDHMGINLRFQCRIGEDYLRDERKNFPALKAAVKRLAGI